jgi:glyoxylase-like metal-dependent hydrolase (beta-lactamase superfamily II)
MLGEDHVLGDDYSADTRMPFVIYAYLAQGPGGETVLIDLGPKSLEYTNAMFRKYKFFRETDGARKYPDDIVQPHGNLFAHLKRLGVPPERVGRIVFTHFHADHHGMDDGKNGGAAEDFPNARLSLSKIGWEFNLAQRKDDHWNSYLDWGFGDLLLAAEKAGRVDLIDNGPIAPGLEVRYLGGHSVCSRAVLVHTADGWAAITSDDIYRYDLLEKGILARLYTTPENLAAATDRLVGLAEGSDRRTQAFKDSTIQDAVLVPLHDPLVWETFEKTGDRWLAALRPVSDRAARGYLASRDKLKSLRRAKDPERPGMH